jgi:3'(2'), 5'-bisphosphate nucleotidase
MFADEWPPVHGRHTGQVTTPETCAGDPPAPGTESDTELANRLAREAGKILVGLRQQLHDEGLASWDVMDHGDATSHRFIADELRLHRPHEAVLDEEGAEDPRRFEEDRVWIIDPLDGTREFGEPGRHDWAVHVALWDRDHFVAGAVALPAIDRLLSTDPAPIVQRARLRGRAPRVGGRQGDGDRAR